MRYAARIATLVERLIVEHEMTRTNAAEQIGMSRSALHDLLTGRTFPDLLTLAKMESLFHVSVWPSTYPIPQAPEPVA